LQQQRTNKCWEFFFFQTPNRNRTNKYWKLIEHKTLELISTASKQQALEFFLFNKLETDCKLQQQQQRLQNQKPKLQKNWKMNRNFC